MLGQAPCEDSGRSVSHRWAIFPQRRSVSLLQEQMWADTPTGKSRQLGSKAVCRQVPTLRCCLDASCLHLGLWGGRKASDPGALGLGGWGDPSQLVVWVTQSGFQTILLPPPSGKSDHSLSFQNQGTSDAEALKPDENSDKKSRQRPNCLPLSTGICWTYKNVPTACCRLSR